MLLAATLATTSVAINRQLEKDGTAQAEVKPTKLSFRFEEVDTDGGTARAVGPFGASDIVVRVSMDTLHFVQSFRDGPLYVTTVIARPAGGGKWLAVHSRHEYTDVSLPGYTSRPEQYLRIVHTGKVNGGGTTGVVLRSPFSVLRSPFVVLRSACCVLRSSFCSTFDIRSRTLGTMRSQERENENRDEQNAEPRTQNDERRT